MEDNLNTIKTTFLLAIMTSFFIFIGQIIGGQSGMFIAFVFAAVMNIASYWYSDKIVLKPETSAKVELVVSPQAEGAYHHKIIV